MKAVILVGGRGTRLGSVTERIPKPLVPVNGKAILDHQLEQLQKYGFSEVILMAGHLSQSIESHVGAWSSRGLAVRTHHEPTPLGTAGALREIESELTEDFLLVYGDVLFSIDLNRLIDFHRLKNGIASLVVHPNDHPSDSDLLERDDFSRISAFHPKPHDQRKYFHNLVNAGMYVFSKKILKHIPPGVSSDFGKDVFPKMLDSGALFAYVTPEYIKDMGTPERLKQVSADCASGKVERWNLENCRPAIFLDRDGVINEDAGHVHSPEQFRLLPGVAEAIQLINKSDYLSLVVTNQPVVARGLCSMAGVDEIHRKMATVLGSDHAWLDAVYFCPHHPDGGFPEENSEFKVNCSCRKPKDGMIQEARKHYRIEMSESWMIGDSQRDILCGKTAGLQTIGLRTGAGCRDGSSFVPPDYMFENLLGAVKFILGSPCGKILKSTMDRILGLLDEKRGEPVVVSVAGNSRSGKSTFASLLRRRLNAQGIPALGIGLDDWILPIEERADSMNVLDRFQVHKIESDLARFFSGERVTLRPYTASDRRLAPEPVFLELGGNRVVIVEGVPALATDALRDISDHGIFMEISHADWRNGVAGFQAWKGLGKPELEKLLEKRTKDEFEVVSLHAKYADSVVTFKDRGDTDR